MPDPRPLAFFDDFDRDILLLAPSPCDALTVSTYSRQTIPNRAPQMTSGPGLALRQKVPDELGPGAEYSIMCYFEYIQHVCPCDKGTKCTQQYRGMADAQHPDGRIIIGHRMDLYTPAPGRACSLQRHRFGKRAQADPACPQRDYTVCTVVDTRLHHTLCNDCLTGWTGSGCAGVK